MSLRTGLGSPSSGCRQGHGPKEPPASPRLLPLRLWGTGVFSRGGRRTACVRSSQSGCGLTSPGTDFPACWRAQRKKHRQCTLPCVHSDLRVGGSAPHPGSEGGDGSSRSLLHSPGQCLTLRRGGRLTQPPSSSGRPFPLHPVLRTCPPSRALPLRPALLQGLLWPLTPIPSRPPGQEQQEGEGLGLAGD